MASCLITQTLLSSWLYMFNCAEGYEWNACDDFIRALNRIPSEANDAILDGIAFENGVYALVDDPNTRHVRPEWAAVSKQIANILRGGQLQVRGSARITVDGEPYLLYGIADGIKAGIIYDVKKKHMDFGMLDLAGNYLESPQHPAYFRLFSGAYRFVYLVSDGKELYTEVYERKDAPPIEGIISNFVKWLRDSGLYDIYRAHWVMSLSYE